MTYTTEQKLKAIERELALRRRVYARQIMTHRISQQFADEQIAIFEAIRRDYLDIEAKEKLL
jgi:hypothetical protein